MPVITSNSLAAWCRTAMAAYLELYPQELSRLKSLHDLLDTGLDIGSRTTVPGHLTSSGIVFDPSDKRFLLIHHNMLDRWLQPGGHMEPGELPYQAARREVKEETGISVDNLLSRISDRVVPIDIDSHTIPASSRKGEPAHTHHDFRFAFTIDRALHHITLQEEEVADAVWMELSDSRFPVDLKRCVDKVFAGEMFPVE